MALGLTFDLCRDGMLFLSAVTGAHSLPDTPVRLLQVPIRDTCPQKRWSKKVSGIGVTTVTIMRTKNDSLSHLKDLIVLFGISIVIEAERRL